MGLLGRTELLTREELSVEKVELGNDQFVYVRQMTGRERDYFEQSLLKEIPDGKGGTKTDKNLNDFRAKLVVNCMCDDKGVLLLGHNDYGRLSESMSAFKLEKIVNVAQRLNAMTEEDKEGLLKNLEVGPADNSNSDSAENLV
jgi:hypothetical protein